MLQLDWNIVWTIVNVIVLYLFLAKFLFKPVNEIMAQRTKIVEDAFKEADTAKEEALQLKGNYEELLGEAKNESLKIIREAKERAQVDYQTQMRETKEEAARVMQEANRTIKLEKQKTIENAQSEIAGIALLAASKVLQKNVDENTNKQLVGDFLKEAGASK